MRRNSMAAALAAGGFAAALAGAAAAQTVGEVTVVAKMGADGRPAELSRVISIADLDLTTQAGEDALRGRVRDTARELCAELGETGGASGLTRSCEEDAVVAAKAQMEMAVAQARSGRAYAAAPPAPLPEPAPEPAPSASAAAAPASVTTSTVTNGPVPDTPENRARYGQPLSRAGKLTAPRGN